MRLFVAVDPPPLAGESLAGALPQPPDPQLRWVPSEQWHLTLAFLGSVDPSVVPRLGERLARAAERTPPLVLRLAGAGAFPRAARGRVLWVGLDGAVRELRQLADRVAAAARHSGVALDDRPYRAHLTLARVRAPGGADIGALVAALAGYRGPDFPVSEIRLVESHLGAHVRHDVVAAWQLHSSHQA